MSLVSSFQKLSVEPLVDDDDDDDDDGCRGGDGEGDDDDSGYADFARVTPPKVSCL